MSSVVVSDKSNDGIQNSLAQINKIFGIPVGYTRDIANPEDNANPEEDNKYLY